MLFGHGMIQLHFLSKADSPSSQRDDPTGASTVCSPAHLPLGEPEEGAGHHQLSGGEAAADSRGLCEITGHFKTHFVASYFTILYDLLHLLGGGKRRHRDGKCPSAFPPSLDPPPWLL